MRTAGGFGLVLVAVVLFGTRAEVVDDIMDSLSRGVSFLERQHAHINLDGAVGYVMLQGRSADPNPEPDQLLQGRSAEPNLHDAPCSCRSADLEPEPSLQQQNFLACPQDLFDLVNKINLTDLFSLILNLIKTMKH